jgi:DNA-binding GntR family transcriptional regulator
MTSLGTLAPLERMSLGSQAYHQIRHALMVGELRPGQTLTYRGMAAQLNTSVTPVREALLQLLAENVLEVGPARSVTVPVHSEEKVLELRQIRLLTEVAAAETACTNITDAVIAELEILHGLMAGAEGPRERSRYNQRFHFRLYEAARMPTLLAIIETVWVTIGPLNYYVFERSKEFFWRQKKRSGQERIHPHVEVLAGLRQQDAPRLRAAIERDINEAVQISLDALRSA